MRAVLFLAVIALPLLAVACGGDGATSVTDDGTATIVLGGEGVAEELTVELARTPEERSRGLMNRENLAENAGMLFVFPEDTQTGFWMKDTLIPLSIAFIAADGTILEIQDMQPLSTNLHLPARTYRYALEVNQGWFQQRGIGVGDSVEVPDGVAATQ